MHAHDPKNAQAEDSAGSPSTEEKSLLAELNAGNAEAFTRLIQQHHGRLLRLAMTFVPSRAIAEEVVQETWLAAIVGLGKFEGRSSVKTWLFRILVNRAKTRGVRERRSVPISSLGDGGLDAPAVDPGRFKENGMWATPPRQWDTQTPEKLLADHQMVRRLEAAIEKLPQAQRAVVTLRDIEGLSSQDVCNVLEVSETNQRVLLHRARSHLRATLADHVETE